MFASRLAFVAPRVHGALRVAHARPGRFVARGKHKVRPRLGVIYPRVPRFVFAHLRISRCPSPGPLTPPPITQTQSFTTTMGAIVVPPATVVPHREGETFNVKGLRLTDHFFTVPLDHFVQPSDDSSMDAPASRETITVFAREVIATSKASDPTFDKQKLPALLFLQGGPGFEAARPTETGGWLCVFAFPNPNTAITAPGRVRCTAVTLTSTGNCYVRHKRTVLSLTLVTVQTDYPDCCPYIVQYSKPRD